VSRAQRSTSEAKWCAADPGSSQSVAVPISGAPLHFVEFILGPREARTRGRCTASGTRGL